MTNFLNPIAAVLGNIEDHSWQAHWFLFDYLSSSYKAEHFLTEYMLRASQVMYLHTFDFTVPSNVHMLYTKELPSNRKERKRCVLGERLTKLLCMCQQMSLN